MKITPSSLWQGNPAAGSPWSEEQLRELKRAGVRNPEGVATATVKRVPRTGGPAGFGLPPEPIYTTVPRLAITRDGRRAKIVTPAGAVQWVDIEAATETAAPRQSPIIREGRS